MRCDVAVIGSGPAGMAASESAALAGASVCLIEREERMGGVLKQCVHDGFGLFRFGEKLTGPEYAWRYAQRVRALPVDFMGSTYLKTVRMQKNSFQLELVNSTHGVFSLQAQSLVTAMGCRERTDRQIFLHGERPAGVFTAGQAQHFINIRGLMPGRRCVILGSGDIGLIMARRLTLEGAEVEGVYEVGERCSGLPRNVAQCLEDYDIPLHLRSTVLTIHGRERVEAVTVAQLDERGQPQKGTKRRIECDALILSVGLIPENDLLAPLEPEMDPLTRGPAVDQWGQTSVPGLFSCGNALQVCDLVDHVSESGHRAGTAAAHHALQPQSVQISKIPIRAQNFAAYTVPQQLQLPSTDMVSLSFRPKKPLDKAQLRVLQGGKELVSQTLHWLRPAEMQNVPLDLSLAKAQGPCLEVHLEQVTP